MKHLNHYIRFSQTVILVSLLFSCSRLRNRELYAITDDIIENISMYYTAVPFDYVVAEKFSNDGKIMVKVIGQYIFVELLYDADRSEYERLMDHLSDRYSNNPKVNSIFINNRGTITIYCR